MFYSLLASIVKELQSKIPWPNGNMKDVLFLCLLITPHFKMVDHILYTVYCFDFVLIRILHMAPDAWWCTNVLFTLLHLSFKLYIMMYKMQEQLLKKVI